MGFDLRRSDSDADSLASDPQGDDYARHYRPRDYVGRIDANQLRFIQHCLGTCVSARVGRLVFNGHSRLLAYIMQSLGGPSSCAVSSVSRKWAATKNFLLCFHQTLYLRARNVLEEEEQ